MDQQPLWIDSLEEAVQAAVMALGGPKKVASMLWPSMRLADAARKLNHCLDSERPEKLSGYEFELIGEKARETGCHTIIHYLAKRWNYEEPKPIEPETEQAKLMRDYIKAVEEMKKMTAQMEHVSQLKAVSNQ